MSEKGISKSYIIKVLNKKMRKIRPAWIKKVIKGFLSSIKENIMQNKSVFIRGFGTFRLVERKQKLARNPKTGEKVIIPPRKTVVFKLATPWKRELNPHIQQK